MQLREFTFISPSIETGQVFKAMESAIPTALIDQVTAKNARRGQRQRKLPAHLVVCLVIAMSLWSKVAMRDVLKNLVDGMSVQWTRLSKYWKTPNSASITEARQRLGSQVMRQLFEQVVHPMATPATPGAFLSGLRLMAIDGTLLDVPDSVANAKVFGYPGTRFGHHAAFPKVRLVMRNCCRNAFDLRCLDLSLSDGRTGTWTQTLTLDTTGSVANVGQRTTFVSYGCCHC